MPDLHHFAGRGGKDIIPLYRDAQGTPNVDPKLRLLVTERHRSTDGNAVELTVERLFAYVFGILAGTDYTTRFHDALETQGPRVPLTADPTLFEAMVRHGEQLLWLQTFGERLAEGRGELPLDGIAWKQQPTRPPADRKDVSFDETTQELRIADGLLAGVPPEAYAFEVSGMAVIRKWLGYRMAKPVGKAASSKSSLDKIHPTSWSPAWSQELVEIVAVLRESLVMVPTGAALLDEIIAGALITSDELPPIPDALRKPPSVKARRHDGVATLFSDMKPGTDTGQELF